MNGDPREYLQEAIAIAVKALHLEEPLRSNAVIITFAKISEQAVVDKCLSEYPDSCLSHLRRIHILSMDSFEDTFDILSSQELLGARLILLCVDHERSTQFKDFSLFSALLSIFPGKTKVVSGPPAPQACSYSLSWLATE